MIMACSTSLLSLTFTCLILGLVQSQTSTLFNCQPTSQQNGQVYSPNIPDFYFDDRNAASFITRRGSNLTVTQNGLTYIFSPPTSQPHCTGTVVAVEYCYRVPRSVNNEIDVFSFLSLSRNGDEYTVVSRIDIRNRPSSTMCTSLRDSMWNYCCDKTTLSTQISIPSSSYSYGITVVNNDARPLAFGNLATEFHFTHLQLALGVPGPQETETFTPSLESSSVLGPLLVMRFFIDSEITETESSSTAENDMSSFEATTVLGNSDAVNVALVGGVVGGISAVSIVFLLCVVFLLVVVSRRSKKYTVNTSRNVPISNVLYDELEERTTADPHAYLEFTSTTADRNNSRATYENVTTYSHDETLKRYSTEALSPEENAYIIPAKDENALYSQLKQMKTQALSRDSIKLRKKLGSGQFGVVYNGVWGSPKGDLDVAVKTLKEGSGEEDKIKFLQEAAIMGQFKHPNVVTMYGVVTTGEPILIVLELLSGGDLKEYLEGFRSAEGGVCGIDDHTLLSYCRQVASGMVYLSNKAFVHRDLAARNILVSNDYICKIADFGMSRDLMDENYYISSGGKIPVKWTAPEALNFRKYSTATDVWSFGVLMYEIWSLGHLPFDEITNSEAMEHVNKGHRLPPPPGCPREVYTIMMSCWHPVASERPNFSEISRQLSLPDPKLLKWSEEDKAVHPEADKLGADLLSAQELYKDMQLKYTHRTGC